MTTPNDDTEPPPVEELLSLIEGNAIDSVIECLARYENASATERKDAIQALRTLAEQRPAAIPNTSLR